MSMSLVILNCMKAKYYAIVYIVNKCYFVSNLVPIRCIFWCNSYIYRILITSLPML